MSVKSMTSELANPVFRFFNGLNIPNSHRCSLKTLCTMIIPQEHLAIRPSKALNSAS